MNEILTSSNEVNNNIESDIYSEIMSNEPYPIKAFVVDNADEQKEMFFNGSTRNPQHSYSLLQTLSPQTSIDRLADIASAINLNLSGVNKLAFEQGVNENNKEAEANFMKLNIELYGEPDFDTFNSLMGTSINTIDEKTLSPENQKIRNELHTMFSENEQSNIDLKPSDKTLDGMKSVVEALYSNFFQHIPTDKDSFNSQDLLLIFNDIVRDEFAESADDWKVEMTKSTAINVNSNERMVTIPDDHALMSRNEVCGLAVHELGVHMLRSIAGSQTNVPLLRTGLSNYIDNEEGVARVMQLSAMGKYETAGEDYYRIAGLMYCENKDFRDTFETMWRMRYLEKIKDNEDFNEAKADKAKQFIYKKTIRITRGTDSLPWFKDLAYFNGTQKIWDYCKTAYDDPDKIMFLTMGKADITNDSHKRILYNALI
jgi:hypothetical protein